MAQTLKAYQARQENPSDVSAAYSFCADLAASHYENFPVASNLISSKLRKHVACLYSFARIADDFSDEPEYEGVRRERLMEWRENLRNINQKTPTHPVFIALKETLKTLNLPVQPFDDLLDAFLQDTVKSRYQNFDEVLDYCRRSANPVGRIVLMIHGYDDEGLFNLSDSICTGLQLANFWQDISVDLKKDRIYIPQEDFTHFSYSEADLRMGVVNERFRNLMKFEVARVCRIFEQGQALPKKLSWPLSWEIRLTELGGRQILRKIRKQNYDTLNKRPTLTKWEWIPLLLRAVLK
jgi:squalene synthase HpnC